MIRVGVLGAGGRMGREICRAVEAATDLSLVARVDPAVEPSDVEVELELEPVVRDRPQGRRMQVAVDFTHPFAVLDNARTCLRHGVHIVVGTSGVTPEALEEIRSLADAGEANAIVVPNFAVGAVLMMRFAEEAARHFDAAEVIELHHDG